MVLSKRERYIALVTFMALAILLVDRLALGPILERKAEIDAEMQRVLGDLEHARVLFARKKQLLPRWEEMLEAGLRLGPAGAESQALHAVRNWSQEARLSLASLRPERVVEHDDMEEITFQASGTGGMGAVVEFLWQVENSAIPVRITELQLGTRKEGTDDLSLQVRISTLCRSDEPKLEPPVQGPTTQNEGESDD